jgi:hypothetical protein
MWVGIWETEPIARPQDGQKRAPSSISAEQVGQRTTVRTS